MTTYHINTMPVSPLTKFTATSVLRSLLASGITPDTVSHGIENDNPDSIDIEWDEVSFTVEGNTCEIWDPPLVDGDYTIPDQLQDFVDCMVALLNMA